MVAAPRTPSFIDPLAIQGPKFGSWCRTCAVHVPESDTHFFLLARWLEDDIGIAKGWLLYSVQIKNGDWHEQPYRDGTPIHKETIQTIMHRFETVHTNNTPTSLAEQPRDLGGAHFGLFFACDKLAGVADVKLQPRTLTIAGASPQTYYHLPPLTSQIKPLKMQKGILAQKTPVHLLSVTGVTTKLTLCAFHIALSKRDAHTIWHMLENGIDLTRGLGTEIVATRGVMEKITSITISDERDHSTLREISESPPEILDLVLQYFVPIEQRYQDLLDLIEQHSSHCNDSFPAAKQFTRLVYRKVQFGEKTKPLDDLIEHVIENGNPAKIMLAFKHFPQRTAGQLKARSSSAEGLPILLRHPPAHRLATVEAMRFMLDMDLAAEGTLLDKRTRHVLSQNTMHSFHRHNRSGPGTKGAKPS